MKQDVLMPKKLGALLQVVKVLPLLLKKIYHKLQNNGLRNLIYKYMYLSYIN